MNTEQKIIRIARQARKWTEHLQEEEGRWDATLSGMCGIGSYELFRRLSKASLDPKMCFGNGHVFVRCQGFTADVTATQFSCHSNELKPVEVVKTRSACQLNTFWVSDGTTRTEQGIMKGFKHWSTDHLHPELRKKRQKSRKAA
jgi:hypothetical protein